MMQTTKSDTSFLKETIKTWQSYSKKPLTAEDAREITDNMVDLVIYLNDLDKKYKENEQKKS